MQSQYTLELWDKGLFNEKDLYPSNSRLFKKNNEKKKLRSLYCIKANYTYKHSKADPSDCNQAVIEQKL